MDATEHKKLATELLNADAAPAKPATPKRNSKDALRANILKVVEKYDLDFPLSDTKLKRMNKEQLTKVLAGVMEEGVKQDMARQVGVDPKAPTAMISLGALRMVHGICARGVETAWNNFAAEPSGVAIKGFASTLEHPDVARTVDECLMEIAEQNPEVLQYFESPYARLSLVWVGVLSSSIRKHVPDVRPRGRPQAAARRPGGGGRPTERQEHRPDEPRIETV